VCRDTFNARFCGINFPADGERLRQLLLVIPFTLVQRANTVILRLRKYKINDELFNRENV